MRCVQTNKEAQTASFIKLNTLPNTTNETFLRQCLRNCNGPTPRSVYVGRTKNNASGWAKITFHNDEERDRAAAIYNSQLCNNIFLITILGKSGLKQKPVRTSVTKNDDPFARNNRSSFLSKNIFHLTTISREAALQIFSSHIYPWIVDSSATVTISHIDLYPNFEETIDGICQRFDVQVKCKRMSNLNKCRCIFSNGNPQKTSLAAFMLAQTFAPINIRLNTELQKQLFRELEDVGEIQKWAKELDLAINPNKYWTNIEILGPQTSQGRLMRQIADYSESFNERFYEFELSATVATFFGQQKSASVKLQQITSKWSTKACSIAFNRKTATITLIGKPNVSSMDLKACESEVLQLLNELTATTDDLESDVDEEEDDDDNGTIRFGTSERQERRCVFCQQKSSISTSFFRICGHTYCRCTARALATSHTFPLQCKACQSNIHIRDIQIIFNNNEQLYLSLLKSSIHHYLTTNHQDDDRVFCPNDECDGLIRLNNSYQICLTCGQNVCPRCQVIDDELHIGRTCDQVAEEKKHHPFLSQVFSAAKKFVQNNWPFDPLVRPVGQMYENPYLRKEYQALLRFYKANEILGHSSPPDLAKGFFAYHGSPAESIVPICQNGFDPNRRLNQVHGPGEYFGISAIISDTYTKKAGNHTGFNQMIIAFILRCTQITKIDHFCYVVNNPIDWTYAFNLPVLIVTYGQAIHRQLSPFPTEIPYYSDIESLWMSPFQWHWQQHNRQFHSYNDTMNEILEKVYQHWKLYDGPTEIETPLLSSCLTDTSDVYKFDFQRNKQTNTRTSCSRSIERRLVRTLSDNRHWFYCNEDDTWVRHEQMAEKQIEQAFQSYRTGQGSFIADIQFSGHSEIYQFNFLKGQQRNKSVAKMLSIKRE
ncbi:hypothetical protein I4U23_003856 [Adineta vaga]|nr:hypothetical protein I4U23_003856 [Adineta vaga]